MTVIVRAVLGGRVLLVVDRKITQQFSDGTFQTVDNESNKVLVVLSQNALMLVAYTGVAVTNQKWMDHRLAELLTHKELEFALAQPGARRLARHRHEIITELVLNLNSELNSDSRIKSEKLRVVISGVEFKRRCLPFSCVLARDIKADFPESAPEENHNLYFSLEYEKLPKHGYELQINTYGDDGGESGIKQLIRAEVAEIFTREWTYDSIEMALVSSVQEWSRHTNTVSTECIAIQCSPFNESGDHIKSTFYPVGNEKTECPFFYPWVLTPKLISAPTNITSSTMSISDCRRYLVGGFVDGNTNLAIKTRILVENRQMEKEVLSYKFFERLKVPD